MPTILFIGATGYIGGTVLAHLIQHPKRSDYEIIIHLRSAEKAKSFENLGFKTVLGSLDDAADLEKLTSESDIVFQTADADHLEGTKAILRGFKIRFQKTGIAPILIHTSGTGVLKDNAEGKYEGTDIYSDLDIPKIESLPDTQVHRIIDRTIVAAAEEEYARTWIVLPSTVWGLADSIFVKEGLQKPSSQQIPDRIKLNVRLGKAVYIGEGENVWPHVHIDEVGKFYRILFDAIVSGKQPASGRNGYYFLESGEYRQRDVVEVIAKALYARGKVASPEAIPLSEAGLDPESYRLVPVDTGTNSRARGERSRQLGWNPPQTTEDFYASIQADVDYLLKTH
ncbi:NAD(P)-binding protein [Thelephora ganbajun]|uniref:NAD(P)-binding protein n=1 Tax=Thelephora ganbajun TaxID=370292 RepID=A0ACB6ZBV6_THEGA|nr:NAD(P)-binding protein [Thelephora ganbajun]